MKQDICRFALKMVKDKCNQDELVDHILQYPVCKKFETNWLLTSKQDLA